MSDSHSTPKRYPEMTVRGTPREMGRQIGDAVGDLVRGFCEEALSAIHALLTLAPIPILLVLIFLTLVYRLDEQTHDEIVREISVSDTNSDLI